MTNIALILQSRNQAFFSEISLPGGELQEKEEPVLLDLSVHGMTCASCVARVEKVLRRDPGVHEVAVNLATNRAWLKVDSDLLPDSLIDRIEKAGYRAELSGTKLLQFTRS